MLASRSVWSVDSRLAAGILTLVVGLLSVSSPLFAQRARVGGVPRETATEAARIFNAATTRRIRGAATIPASDTIAGDLAILDGSLRLAGVVRGEVVVLNGDVTLEPTARIERHLTVIGGLFASQERPQVGGEIRVWSARFRYEAAGDSVVIAPELFRGWTRWTRDEEPGRESQLFVTTAHTYNRVEGLPFFVGPRVRLRAGAWRARTELFGILRTGDGLAWRRENLGHRALLELRRGQQRGLAVGGRLFDEVDAVEQWQLSDAEVGLSSFIFKRDYRDYWQRHGGQGYLTLFGGRGVELRAGLSRERWSSRRGRDAFTLFGNGIAWRPNPEADAGRFHLFTLSGTIDTRTNPEHPRAGWYIRGEYERGQGDVDRPTAVTTGLRPPVPTVSLLPLPITSIRYARLLVDARRYTRLGPNSQLNLRAVFGGWVDGDALPMQRRFSVSGIDALPGYDFRRIVGSPVDVGSCATGLADTYWRLGRPAQCDRMVLAQAELKGDFRIRLFGDDQDLGARRWSFSRLHADGTWVLFANSGRGWLVGSAVARPEEAQRETDGLWYPNTRVPGIRSWRTDLGGGFDFGSFGVYVAKSVADRELAPNVYLRLGRRF